MPPPATSPAFSSSSVFLRLTYTQTDSHSDSLLLTLRLDHIQAHQTHSSLRLTRTQTHSHSLFTQTLRLDHTQTRSHSDTHTLRHSHSDSITLTHSLTHSDHAHRDVAGTAFGPPKGEPPGQIRWQSSLPEWWSLSARMPFLASAYDSFFRAPSLNSVGKGAGEM